MKTGIIGNGYWGKILESKIGCISDLIFIQNSKNYNPLIFNEIDWIFIATPTDTHYQIAKDCIEKKINIFIEKPFCNNLKEAEELVDLAKENNLKLYVDNVFLLRSELKNISINNHSNTIEFIWHKSGPFNDTLVNDLLYHDLYILINYYIFTNIDNIKVVKNEINILIFSFTYGNTIVNINYDRTGSLPQNKTIIINNDRIKFFNKNQDPLFESINNCLNTEVDFEKNQLLNLQTMKLLECIKEGLKQQSLLL